VPHVTLPDAVHLCRGVASLVVAVVQQPITAASQRLTRQRCRGADVDGIEKTLQIMSEEDTGQIFLSGLVFEASLGVVAVALSYIFKANLGPLLATGISPSSGVLLGVAWSLPLIVALLLLRKAKNESFM
jgi:hypothetical protein